MPNLHNFITPKQWSIELPKYLNHYDSKTAPFPYRLVHQAYHLMQHLIRTSKPSVLIHGDLHHDNILKSQTGWTTVIDPKGIAAEPEYKTAAMIRNPYLKLDKHPDIKNILQKGEAQWGHAIYVAQCLQQLNN